MNEVIETGGKMALIHFVIVAIIAVGLWALYGIPLYKLLARVGFNPWLSALAIIPFAGLVLIWFIAFSRWPRDEAAIGQEK